MQAVPAKPFPRLPLAASFAMVQAPPLPSLGAGIRWATLALAVILAAGSGTDPVPVGAWAVVLGGIALWQGDRREQARIRISVVIELIVAIAAVVTTGDWESPFVFCVLGSVMILAFGGGFGAGVRAAAAASVAIAVPFHLGADGVTLDSLSLTGQWTVEFGLVALL